MEYGKIKSFSEFDGTGYIETDDGRIVYFQQSALRTLKSSKSIARGAKVYFSLLETQLGLEANFIELV